VHIHPHEFTPAVIMTAMTRLIMIGVALIGFVNVKATLTVQTLVQSAAVIWPAFK
jgi:hypothetical protein